MNPGAAPVTVDRFLKLALVDHYYDGLTIHRVVPNFVIQGGSPGANEYVGHKDYMRDEIGAAEHAAERSGCRRAAATPPTRSSSSTWSTTRGSTGTTRCSRAIAPPTCRSSTRIQEGDVMRRGHRAGALPRRQR